MKLCGVAAEKYYNGRTLEFLKIFMLDVVHFRDLNN
jgi:hypothetical protein